MDQEALQGFRAKIDQLDEQIVALLAERTKVVRQLMVLKSDVAAVRSPDRVEQVIDRVRQRAKDYDIDPVIVEKTYRALIEALTEMQIQYLRGVGKSQE